MTVDVPVFGKHGIFRFWDLVDDNDSHARRDPEDIEVTRDGQDEPFELSNEDHGRYRVAKIGSADVTLDTGEHVYVINYRIDGVITKGRNGITDQPSQFYWQLIPGGWQQTIDEARLIVHLPVESESEVQCAIGFAPTDGCEAEVAGTTDLTIDTGPIAPRTPLSIATGLDMADPRPATRCPGRPAATGSSGRSVPVLGIVLLLGLGAGIVGGIAGARSREKPPGFPVLYAPPDGLGPAQATYIYSETVDREAYVATLMYAAEKGAVELDPRRRHLDHHRPQRSDGLGRARPGHPRQRAPPRRPGRHLHRDQEGRLGRAAAQERDRALRQQRGAGRSSGNLVKSGSAAWAACSSSPASPRSSPSRSGTRSR